MTNELILLVKAEAEKLRIHATEEELARLDFGSLKPHRADLCIYGQMTGDCYSERATQLLKECTEPFSMYVCRFESPLYWKFIQSSKRDYSPIEVYINQFGAKNESLIKYLKGEAEVLEI